MSFTSTEFGILFGAVFSTYFFLTLRWQNALLLVASYVFYGWWDYRFLALIAISTVIDFTVAISISRSSGDKRRWNLLLVSVIANLGFLGFFKYSGFFANSLIVVLRQIGVEPDIPTLQIVLPVGISFYTFQTMAYTIDVYRRKIEPTTNFIHFAVYVSYFPQLVAGPIERASRLLPQFTKRRHACLGNVASGCALAFYGYIQKVVIADNAALLANQVFSNHTSYSGLGLLLGVYLFAIQIYGDFAGYSNIARGVSRVLGIDLCVNFRQPYLAASLSEFWQRWHISLSQWLRDYLYIPLGGNRCSALRMNCNLLVTMLLGGLWHGASWKFVIWGALHGTYLIVQRRLLNLTDPPRTRFATCLQVFLTFHFVCLAWIFFRAANASEALQFIAGLTGTTGLLPASLVGATVVLMSLVVLSDLICEWSQSETVASPRFSSPVRGFIYACMIVLLLLVGANEEQPFIYFQF